MFLGLNAHQAALDTTGNNVSNSSTEGYSRQRAEIVTTYSQTIYGMGRAMQIGNGADVASIVRLRDNMTDRQMWREAGVLGGLTKAQNISSKIEEVFQEPSDTGIQSVIDNFYSSWQDLSQKAYDQGTQAQVRQRGQQLVDSIATAKTQLENIAKDINEELVDKTAKLNETLSEVAALNKQIFSIEYDGKNHANDLRDRRDLLVDQLSTMAGVKVSEESNGMVTLKIGSDTVVEGKNAVTLATLDCNRVSLFTDFGITATRIYIDPSTSCGCAAGGGERKFLDFESGEVAGLIEGRDSMDSGIQGYLNKVADICQFLQNDFNAAHRAGYGYDDTTGNNFFGTETVVVDGKEVGATLQGITDTTVAATVTTAGVSTTFKGVMAIADATPQLAHNLKISDGTKSLTIDLSSLAYTTDPANPGYRFIAAKDVAAAINSQAVANDVDVYAKYDGSTQKFSLYTTGASTALDCSGSDADVQLALRTDLRIIQPDTANPGKYTWTEPKPSYWLDMTDNMVINPDIYDESNGLAKIAIKSSAGEIGEDKTIDPTTPRSGTVKKSNSLGGTGAASVTGSYAYNPNALPVQVRIKALAATPNSDGSYPATQIEYSSDSGSTWTTYPATAPTTAPTNFQFTVANASITMTIAADADNKVGDTYYVTLPSGNEGVASGSNAVNMSNRLTTDTSWVLGNASMNTFYNVLIGELGIQGQQAEDQVTNQTAVITQITNWRESVAGVNMDEEFTNMVKFQKGYSGCARIVTCMDEMLDTLINSTGTVGR